MSAIELEDDSFAPAAKVGSPPKVSIRHVRFGLGAALRSDMTNGNFVRVAPIDRLRSEGPLSIKVRRKRPFLVHGFWQKVFGHSADKVIFTTT